ncbi:hypothetical protein [uncultured Methylibium sp.]|uniref:hypothetical protein n=1 Tax=uncultured Methylibium sp. TaxID=381093 RepID=UPI0025EAB03B|nr:hypothetical protein [uncultured Methylibium sp.]
MKTVRRATALRTLALTLTTRWIAALQRSSLFMTETAETAILASFTFHATKCFATFSSR